MMKILITMFFAALIIAAFMFTVLGCDDRGHNINHGRGNNSHRSR